MGVPTIAVSRHQISVCTFLGSKSLGNRIDKILASDRYATVHLTDREVFLKVLEQDKHQIDCLIFEQIGSLLDVVRHLHRQATLLPAVILVPQNSQPAVDSGQTQNPDSGQKEATVKYVYHTAELKLGVENIQQVPRQIERAIAKFLQLSTACRLPQPSSEQSGSTSTLQQKLSIEQQRLSAKLKERLGYLGVYYKRDPQQFFRRLPPPEQERLLKELQTDYREIVLSYFQEGKSANRKIDDYVNKIFFADISVHQVLEIHMELMDDFSRQLKLEGRSEDILIDYRLTLIDTVAHLCEMYRRSIPRDA